MNVQPGVRKILTWYYSILSVDILQISKMQQNDLKNSCGMKFKGIRCIQTKPLMLTFTEPNYLSAAGEDKMRLRVHLLITVYLTSVVILI